MVSKYEIKAKKELEAEGWRVDDKRGMGRFSKNRDFWNLFDLVAVRPDTVFIRWISIKGHVTGSPITAHTKEIREFYLPPGNQKELWQHPKRKKQKASPWLKKIIT